MYEQVFGIHMMRNVCCYVWFTYAREVCIHCISIYGEAYAHAFGSCVLGVVIGRAHPSGS